MSSGVPTNSANRTVSVAAAALLDADGILTSFATATSPRTFDVADFNGAAIDAAGDTGRLLVLPRCVTITRSNNANQFSVSPIVITGKRGPNTVTESITPATDDGNDVLHSTNVFDYVLTIDFPADGGTGGTYTVGVENFGTPQPGDTFTGVKLDAAGTLVVQYGEAVGSPTDPIPCDARALELIAPTRILTNASLSPTTIVGFTAYIP